MTPSLRLIAPLSAVLMALWLSGCAVQTAPNSSASGSGHVSNGCPYTPFSHPYDGDDRYVDIPPYSTGEAISDVLIPSGKPVGCENPRFRLVHGTEKDSAALFDRLTKDATDLQIVRRTTGYGVDHFLTKIRIRPDHIAVGWRGRVDCRRPLVWIFLWPDDPGQRPGVNPVLLEFADEHEDSTCKPYAHVRDADGGGP